MKNTDSRFLYKAKRTVNNEWVQGYIFKTGECYKILPTDFVSPALSVQELTIRSLLRLKKIIQNLSYQKMRIGKQIKMILI